MNRRAMVVVPLVALATVVISAATSGGSTHHLPLPKTVANGAVPHRGPAGNGNSGSSDTGASSGSSGQTYTTTPPPPLTGCTVSLSNPYPPRGQTAETATVLTTVGAHVRLDATYYRTPSVHGGVASANGSIAFPLPISHATPGIPVRVTATASLRGVKRSCTTSFTPHF